MVKQIKLHQFDYGYRVPEALTKYKLFQRLGCVAVLGWGTGDTEALSPTVTKDKMPYVSASYSGHLTDPTKTPYNLFFATDYSSNAGLPLLHGMTINGHSTKTMESESQDLFHPTCLPHLIAVHLSRP
jgi:hypothetical protein